MDTLLEPVPRNEDIERGLVDADDDTLSDQVTTNFLAVLARNGRLRRIRAQDETLARDGDDRNLEPNLREILFARRARQSKLLAWSESTTPVTLSPGGSTTSKG